MKLKTGLFTLLVLSVAAYGGAKFYVNAKVKNKLDDLVRMASPFVQISYGGITSDLRGKLQIDDIAVTASEGAAFQIGSIKLEGPGPRFLWDLTGGFKNSEPPARLALKLTDATVPADQSFSGGFGPINLNGENEDAGQPQPCTIGGLLRHAGLEQIGMQFLVANAVMGYDFNRASGEAQVFLEYDLQGIESMSLSMALQGIPEPGAVYMGAMPSFADIDFTYSLQPGHIKGLVEHCAQQAQQSSEQFIDDIFAQPNNQIARNLGFAPGPGIRELLRNLVSNGGTVQLTAHPADDLNPATLSAYKPEDIMRLLNVEISLDDKPVKDLSLEFAPDGPSGFRGFGMGPQDAMDDSKSDATESAETGLRKKHRRMRYVETEITDLPRYIGSKVKLYTVGASKPRRGFLTRYKGETFSVEQSIHGGTITAHVGVSEIARVEVLRLVP